MKSSLNLTKKNFSEIYIENDAYNYPLTEKILKKINPEKIIAIDNYKNIFSRSMQNFYLQKKSQKIILAVKKDDYIYKGSDLCHDFGYENFYYTSSVFNCLYDCEYCYLQGMYPSAYIVIFVNLEDYFQNLDLLLEKHPVYLSISYDTDLLALDNITGLATEWINYASKKSNLTIELRTKSTNINTLLKNNLNTKNLILGWTLLPEEIINNFEKTTPMLTKRIESMKKAIEADYKVRFSIDPIIYTPEWKEIYSRFMEILAESFTDDQIDSISIGLFRMPDVYFKNILKKETHSKLFYSKYKKYDNTITYESFIGNEMLDFVYHNLKMNFSENKIFILNK